MYISRRALSQQFDPRVWLPETYLICELEWGGSGRFWQHWVRNEDYEQHAEEYFLEEIFEPRNYSFCDMTWYLSWSPCERCCEEIMDFLEMHPNVYIDIRVARLYYPEDPGNRAGLRDLARLKGVTIGVMEAEDYRYCKETFIQSGIHYDFNPENFLPAIWRNRSTLKEIFQVEKGNNIMKEKLRVQFFSFGFQGGKFLDFYLELQSHLRSPPPDSFLTWI